MAPYNTFPTIQISEELSKVSNKKSTVSDTNTALDGENIFGIYAYCSTFNYCLKMKIK
jgi:hypothetical protein